MTLRVRIHAVVWEAPNILSYELRALDGGDLPSFTAGAHIDLSLANGLARSYSLLNSQSERHRYVISVQKDRASRGGSSWIHENLRPGDVIEIMKPRNNFPLAEDAKKSIFIAGGIGITPILSMIGRLDEIGREWELIYCARKRSGAAFVEKLRTKAGVRFNFDDEPGGTMLDIAAVVSSAPADGHLYCCGPLPMLEAFEIAARAVERSRVHVEYFTAQAPAATEGGFRIVLARSARELAIPAGKSILETLVDAGFAIPFSCKEGICGACETHVLEGIPDHRDLVLTEAEREANDKMMICCSGAKSEKLVLDL
jgi:tetrachlorobenzoquinone reductase